MSQLLRQYGFPLNLAGTEQGHYPHHGRILRMNTRAPRHGDEPLPGLGRSLERVQERFTLMLEHRYQQVAHLEGVVDPGAIDAWLMTCVAHDLGAAAPASIAKQHRTKLPPLPKNRNRDR